MAEHGAVGLSSVTDIEAAVRGALDELSEHTAASSATRQALRHDIGASAVDVFVEPRHEVLIDALSHLRRGGKGSDQSTGAGPAELSIHIRFSPHTEPFRNLDFEGHLVLDNDDVGMHLGHDGALALFDKHRGQAIWWFHASQDADPTVVEHVVAPWHRAAPMRQILHWHCVSRGQALLHAAAVSLDGRAALITGVGGSGKSTTSLLCHEAGFGFLADDYCIVEPHADGVAVYGLYRTVKVTQRSHLLVPNAMRHPHIDVDQHKRAVFLPDALPGPLPVDVLLIARVDESMPPQRSRATRMQALAAAGPTSVLQQRGSATDVLGLLADVVRQLPAEHMTVSPAVDAVRAAVRDALQEHRP